MSSTIDSGIKAVADLLREQLPPEMVVTEPTAIAALVRPWNARVERRPSVVARCRTTADVQAAVAVAARCPSAEFGSVEVREIVPTG